MEGGLFQGLESIILTGKDALECPSTYLCA